MKGKLRKKQKEKSIKKKHKVSLKKLKIDKGITYNYETNVVTIDNNERCKDNAKEN